MSMCGEIENLEHEIKKTEKQLLLLRDRLDLLKRIEKERHS